MLWSLAVEEHFYLVYPLLFLGLMRSRRPAFVAGVFGVLCVGCSGPGIFPDLAACGSLCGRVGFRKYRGGATWI